MEALGAGAFPNERQIAIVRLKVELKDLEIGGRAKGEIDGSGHGSGGHVRSVGSQGNGGGSAHPLDASHIGIGRSEIRVCV